MTILWQLPVNLFAGEDLPVWTYLRVIDEALIENELDVTVCLQKLLCRIARNSSQNVAKGTFFSHVTMMNFFREY